MTMSYGIAERTGTGLAYSVIIAMCFYVGIEDRANARMATSSVKGEDRREVVRTRRQALYASGSLAAIADSSSLVSVNVSIHTDAAELDLLRQAAVAALGSPEPSTGKAGATAAAKIVREALKSAAADMFSRIFATEIKEVVAAYRVMLRESLAKGEDSELQAALNRARLQEKVLASTSMVDQAQACQLLGFSNANPSATMKRKEDKREILRFTIDGRAVYPLFQFDVEGRRLFPAMAELIARKPKNWSDFRLLHWLTRLHLDMDGTPAEALRGDESTLIAAFDREIEPVVHG